MFCAKCGTQIEDGVAFCPNCGEATQQEAVNEVTAAEQAPVEVAEDTSAAVAGKPANKNLRILIYAVAALLFVWILTLIFGGGSPEKTAEKYYEAFLSGDVEKANTYTAASIDIDKVIDGVVEYYEEEFDEDALEEMKENAKEEYGTSNLKKAMKKTLKKNIEETDTEYKDEYGSDYKVKYSATKLREYTKDDDEFEDIIEDYNDEVESAIETFDDMDIDLKLNKALINPKKVKSIWKVSIKAKFEGKIESETKSQNLYLAKIGGSWKVIDAGSMGM